jgi:hypothetical protein
MVYVISKWEVSDTGNLNDDNYIFIKGRDSGALSWLFALVGIEPSVTISVSTSSILFSKRSLGGFEKRAIPIASISSAYYGFTKPLGGFLLICLVVLFLAVNVCIGAWNYRSPHSLLYLIILALIPIPGFLVYIFNKTLKLGFVESGGIVSGIEFKPSLIEGERLSEKEVHRVVDIIQQLIDKANKPPVSTRDSVNSLADLKQLYEQRIITAEEYESKRQKLLRGL